ncbi:MAG: hypothetical protein CL920_02900 [Deltaproteobacteria bacterium]|nr:hypothetical protein [Deltaproteobacteria bacterium]
MGETSSELIGLVLKDTYRIDTYLGEGGPSIVYKGTDLLLGVPVAIKRLKLLQQNEEQRELMAERFLREARTQAKLVHQNIVGIRAMLEEKGEYYIIMEFIDGKDLAYRLFDTEGHSKKLPFDEVVPLYEQALAGLGYAHEHGVIHRDIKPSNILVTQDNHVKLADFGIARALDDQRLTKTGFLVGTPIYMSPEQLKSGDIDHRSDIYSMGVALFEALAGKPPFGGDDASSYEIMSQHLFEPPPPLSVFRKDLTPAQITAVMHSLHKEPQARYSTCREFANALNLSLVQPDLSPDELLDLAAKHDQPALITHFGVPLPSSEDLDMLEPIVADKRATVTETPSHKEHTPDAKQTQALQDTPSSPKTTPPLWLLAAAALLIVGGGWYLLNPSPSSGPLSNHTNITSKKKTNVRPKRVKTLTPTAPGMPDALHVPAPEKTQTPEKPQPPEPPSPSATKDKTMVRILGGWYWQGHGKIGQRALSIYTKKRFRRSIKRLKRRRNKRAKALPEALRKLTLMRANLLYKTQTNDHPKRRVYISTFWIDRNEVTVDAYRSCVETGACQPIKLRFARGIKRLFAKPRDVTKQLEPGSPMRYITWKHASTYCTAQGKRLPTEAEWEYAAKGFGTKRYPWGDQAPSCTKSVYYGCNKTPLPHTTSSRQEGKSPSGVFDMAGNVWEWVLDCYDARAYHQQDAKNPSVDREACRRRVVRGGSFQEFQNSPGLTVFYRRPMWHKFRRRDIGFRCASSHPPK